MSIDEIFTLALWMAVLAIAALLLVGRRQPARATRRLPRDTGSSMSDRPDDPTGPAPIGLRELPTAADRRSGPLRRVAALVGLGLTGAVTGALLAIVVSVAVAGIVVTLTGLLG